MAGRSTMKGRFIPKNPDKYVGNPNAIFFRSSWELAFMRWLDANTAVLKYGSEEIAIPYVSPLDGRVHKYFPDMVVMYRDTQGNVKKELIEIKPYKETIPTKKSTPQELQVIAVNHAKWKFAKEWAQRNGAEFRVLTERELFLNKANRKK